MDDVEQFFLFSYPAWFESSVGMILYPLDLDLNETLPESLALANPTLFA